MKKKTGFNIDILPDISLADTLKPGEIEVVDGLDPSSIAHRRRFARMNLGRAETEPFAAVDPEILEIGLTPIVLPQVPIPIFPEGSKPNSSPSQTPAPAWFKDFLGLHSVYNMLNQAKNTPNFLRKALIPVNINTGPLKIGESDIQRICTLPEFKGFHLLDEDIVATIAVENCHQTYALYISNSRGGGYEPVGYSKENFEHIRKMKEELIKLTLKEFNAHSSEDFYTKVNMRLLRAELSRGVVERVRIFFREVFGLPNLTPNQRLF